MPNVALTAIQPDVKSRQLRLTGEAKDLAAILAYAEGLNKTRVLSATVLASHEFKMSDGQRVVAFSLFGNWKDTP